MALRPEVQQRLDDLVPVEPHARQARIVVALDLHAGRRLGREQVPDVLHDLVDVDRLLVRRLPRAEQRVDERREPVRLGDDHRRVFVQRRVLELPLEQLRRAAQAAERILDLVRQLPDHRAAAAELRQQVVLARDALVVRRVGQLDEHAAGAAGLSNGVTVTSSTRGGAPGPASNGTLAPRILRARGARAR